MVEGKTRRAIRLWFTYKIGRPISSWKLNRAIKKGKIARGRTK